MCAWWQGREEIYTSSVRLWKKAMQGLAEVGSTSSRAKVRPGPLPHIPTPR